MSIRVAPRITSLIVLLGRNVSESICNSISSITAPPHPSLDFAWISPEPDYLLAKLVPTLSGPKGGA